MNYPEVAGVDFTTTREGNLVTVSVQVAAGYTLAEGASTEWTFDVSPATCPATDVPSAEITAESPEFPARTPEPGDMDSTGEPEQPASGVIDDVTESEDAEIPTRTPDPDDTEELNESTHRDATSSTADTGMDGDALPSTGAAQPSMCIAVAAALTLGK